MPATSDDWDSFAPPPEGTHPPLDSPAYRNRWVTHRQRDLQSPARLDRL